MTCTQSSSVPRRTWAELSRRSSLRLIAESRDLWDSDGRPTRRQAITDLAAGALFCLVLMPLQWPTAPVATALLALALALRRLVVPGMVVCAVLAGVLQLLTQELALGADLAYVVLFYTLGRHPQRRWRRTGLAAAVVATMVGAPLLTVPGTDATQRWVVLAITASFLALFSFGGWLAGLARWQSVRSVQTGIAARLAQAEQRRLNEAFSSEQERARIAADMHDVVAHSWAVVAAQADGARYALRTSPEAAETALQVIAETARATISDLRRIVGELRGQPSAAPAPDRERTEHLLARMRASGMRLDVSQVGDPAGSPLLQLTALRVLGECLTNALKHGDLSRSVVVHEDWTEGYTLSVTNAIRRPAAPAIEGTGHGLIGMSQRVAIAGGRISTGVHEDQFRVWVELPAVVQPPGSLIDVEKDGPDA